MVWTVNDVEEHRKGLKEPQKKRWCKVANSVLTKCEKRGGKECDAMAIKIANSMFEPKRVK